MADQTGRAQDGSRSILVFSVVSLFFVRSLTALPDIHNFRLNFSTPGYDSRGTKRVLVRTLTAIALSDLSPADSRWELKDSVTATTVASGPLAYFGTTYGIQYWVADFTAYKGQGRYSMAVTLRQNAGTMIGTRQTLTFPVQKSNFSKTMLMDLSLNNADLRQVHDFQAGFCDATSTGFREAYSHAIFLYGLMEMYKAK